jgi:hypothetical protein
MVKKSNSNKKKNIKKTKKTKNELIIKNKDNTKKNNNYNKNINKRKNQKNVLYNIKGGNIMAYVKFYKDDDDTHHEHKNRCACVDYDFDKNKHFTLENNKEIRRCNNSVLPGKKYCKKHLNCHSFVKQFTNDYEPPYEPQKWSHPYIEGTHNCYAYFLNDRVKAISDKCEELCLKKNKKDCPKKVSGCGNYKPQPGDFDLIMKHGNLKNKIRNYQCDNMEKKIKQDNPSIKSVSFTKKCPKYHYKAAMTVDPGHTFHFYRQNPDGNWSHKPGTLKVTNKDSRENEILIPHYADRNYTKNRKKGDEPIKYSDFCGYYCIPNDKYMNTNLA